MIRRLIGYYVDANLLVLLAVGDEDLDLIAKHRRLDGYSVQDYDILHGLLRLASRVLVTPNTLTEASNLLGLHGEPERSRFMERLRAIIAESGETFVASSTASANNEFERLGLTDAVLLEAATPETPLLTVDMGLFRAAISKGPDIAVNFGNYRESLTYSH